MTIAVQNLLDSFDALTDAEKHEAARELLRRAQRNGHGQIPDQAFVAAAEELFLELDARDTAMLSEPALAEDWNRPEEDAAWSHLQSEK